MNEKEAIDYIYQSYMKAEKYLEWGMPDSKKRHPFFSREIIRKYDGVPCVLVTGSKGKGSAANMIAQILQIEKKIGLMTSPHLESFCERFQVNGKKISGERLAEVIEKLKPDFDRAEKKISEKEFISPMGIQAAAALLYFREEKTDFNVFECGKGVKYDDVNNIRHTYAVINTIFLEHTRELGNSLEEIAKNKAAIITGEQNCVYVGEQPAEAMQIIETRAMEKGVSLKRYGKEFYCENIRYTPQGMLFDAVTQTNRYRNLQIPLLGEHQAKNCALAISVCADILGTIPQKGCAEMLKKLRISGRMELLSADPVTILDACINRESAKEVKKVMQSMDVDKAAVIIGIPDDKDYIGVAEEMQDVAEVLILTKSQNPHYKFTEIQKRELQSRGISAIRTHSIKEAIKEAKKTKIPIIILGTTSLLPEAKQKA